MAKRRKKPSLYYLMLGITLTLVMLGIVMVTSASFILANNQQQDSFYYLKRQIVSVGLGLLLMFFLAMIDYRRIKSFSLAAVILSVVLLVLVIIFGRMAFGSTRWFTIAGFNFQPSELAKLTVVIFTADLLSRNRKTVADIRTLLRQLGIPVLLISFLVLIQPDMGTAFTILISVYILLFLAEMRLRYLMALSGGGLVLASVFIMSAPYRRHRFLAFLNPWGDARSGGFQIIQSLLALGSGGIYGVGLGLSRQKFGYLPTPYTDFIFAVIGEELGLIGSGLVIVLFLIFGFLGMRIALGAKDKFGRLLAGGITATIITQAIINLGAVTGIMPITGIPLPFVSFGGSSLVLTLAGVGMLLSIAANAKRPALKGVSDESNDLRWGDRRPRLSRPRAG